MKCDTTARNSSWTLVVGLIGALLMFWFAQQLRLEIALQQTVAAQRGATLSYLVQRSLTDTAAMQAEVAHLQADVAGPLPNVARLRRTLGVIQQVAGLTAVSGNGVRVVLSDNTKPSFPGEPAQYQLVHDQYVLHIVGLLAGAGATAISINGQRFVSTSAIFCAGPTIRVNGVVEGSPFVVSAVGNEAPMLQALTGDPQVQGWSHLVQLHFGPAHHLLIPALAQMPPLNDAEPVSGG